MLYRVLLLILFSLSLHADVMPPLRLSDVHNQMNTIFRLHPTTSSMNIRIMQYALANYINEFDPNHIYLLASDVDPFLGLSEKALESNVSAYYKEDYSTFEKLNSVIQKSIYRMRALRKRMAITDENVREVAKEPLPTFTQKQMLEASFFCANEMQLEAKARVYVAKRIVDEIDHMKALGMPATYDDAEKAVVYSLKQYEDDYLYLTSQGDPLPREEKEAFFAFHILHALASSLDVHTQFLNPHQAHLLQLQLSKAYVGVGLEVDQEGDSFIVSGIMKGSLAEKSDKIHIGDAIVSIDKRAVQGMGPDEMLSLLHGKEGTIAELVLKNRDNGLYSISLERKPLVVEENRVDSSFEKVPGGILAIIKLHGFYQGKWPVSSAEDVRSAIDELKQNGPILGVLLDLRDNRGGVLTQSVDVAGLFMRSGVVAVAKDTYSRLHFLRHTNPRLFYDGPLVILTSQETASAAEVVAACLQDYGIAIIVGDNATYGKGSLQAQMQNKQVTIGRYYSVSGRSVQLEGVKSDIVVPGSIAGRSTVETLLPDSIEPSYKDHLLDVPRYQRGWFQRYYVPFLQQKTDRYTKYIPQLATLSAERIAKNTNYENLLHGNLTINNANLTQAEANKMLRDYQLAEAITITKDLIRLSEPKIDK